jgi:hypothetical protein
MRPIGSRNGNSEPIITSGRVGDMPFRRGLTAGSRKGASCNLERRGNPANFGIGPRTGRMIAGLRG